jgi:alpha-ketoglutarate-dependent 2,4-dichlorophenoxyacetate dioxygenase
MGLEVKQLHPRFFGEITGADLTAEPTEELREFVESAMVEYAVCVVRQGPIVDEQHIRFARLFGPLELPPGYAQRRKAWEEGKGRFAPELYFAGNLDADGRIRPRPPREKDIATGAERFHADSSFNPLPGKWSMLRGVACPPSQFGGDTLFADTRAAWDNLPQDMKSRLESLVGIHDFWKGRERAGLEVTPEMRATFHTPRVLHPLVRQMQNGRKYLFAGGHCVGIEGMDADGGAALVERLYDHMTQDEYVHRHRWREGDIVIWENRCALHAATPLRSGEYPRDMRRATVCAAGPEVDATAEARKAGAAA